MPSLDTLPVEVIIDNILPFLPVPAISSLSATSKFFYLLTSDETFWKRRLLTDYNFSGNDTARTTGWKFIYKRLANPKVYVWGEYSRRRLGLGPRELPKTSVYEGTPYPIQLRLPHGVRIISLSAGGMSFHALDSQGNVWVWGTLDGTSFALHSEGFSDPHKAAPSPTRLELPFSIRTISCGRLHAAALTTSSQVVNFVSWGRPFVMHSRYFTSSLSSLSPSTHSATTSVNAVPIQTHIPPATPIQVECGWNHTAVLTSSGNVFVYWPRPDGTDRLGRLVYKQDRKFDEQDIGRALLEGFGDGVEGPPSTRCHVWSVDAESPSDSSRNNEDQEIQEEGQIMVKLADLEDYDLPNPPRPADKLDNEEHTKIVKIAGLDCALVGLTNKGHVVLFRGLDSVEAAQNNRWQYLPYFSEVEKVREDSVWADEGNRLQPPDEMKISHISAHFQTFTAYSPNPGVVLMGNMEKDPLRSHPTTTTTTINPPPPFKPTILPALQAPHNTVISVVLGDYHFGALTAAGKLLTWGAFSKGALGLGDPNDLDVGAPGGFKTKQEKDISISETRARRGGMTPDETTIPGEVKFDWEDKKAGREGKERYCFAAAAAGWHMGALVIDLEPDVEEQDADHTELQHGEDPEENMPGAFPNPRRGLPVQPRPILGRGMSPFRIGFAGRAGRGGPGMMNHLMGRGNVPDQS